MPWGASPYIIPLTHYGKRISCVCLGKIGIKQKTACESKYTNFLSQAVLQFISFLYLQIYMRLP